MKAPRKGESVLWRRRTPKGFEEYARDAEGRWWARLPLPGITLGYRTVVPRSVWTLTPLTGDDPPEGCRAYRFHCAKLPVPGESKGAAPKARARKSAGDYLLLKWGTLKAWNLKSEAARAALAKLTDLGSRSMSAALQHDTEAQKQALCDLIDAIDGRIQEDWGGNYLTKAAAKAYVREYDT